MEWWRGTRGRDNRQLSAFSVSAQPGGWALVFEIYNDLFLIEYAKFSE